MSIRHSYNECMVEIAITKNIVQCVSLDSPGCVSGKMSGYTKLRAYRYLARDSKLRTLSIPLSIPKNLTVLYPAG